MEETGRTIVYGNVEGDVVGIFGDGQGDGPLLYIVVSITVRHKHGVGVILRGKMVRSVMPFVLPQGAVLSASALHCRLEGHRKSTGPMVVPSSLCPCTSLAAMATWDSARAAETVVKRILARRRLAQLCKRGRIVGTIAGDHVWLPRVAERRSYMCGGSHSIREERFVGKTRGRGWVRIGRTP